MPDNKVSIYLEAGEPFQFDNTYVIRLARDEVGKGDETGGTDLLPSHQPSLLKQSRQQSDEKNICRNEGLAA